MIAPTGDFDSIEQHPEKVESLFRKKFPGIIPDLISAKSATDQFINNQRISLKSIKCGKFGYEDSAVLLGDAAHTMTPFHAMGLMTGLEDVRVFFEDFLDPAHRKLQETGQADEKFCLSGIVEQYTENRRPDVHAMTDMAVEHYSELRYGVKTRVSRVKKQIERALQTYTPFFDRASSYSRIHFSHERFVTIRQKEARQNAIMKAFFSSLFLTGTFVATSLFYYFRFEISNIF